ncbi:MAG TPA: hypothetical protein VJB65_02760, partial [Patescibacteria group bacterium]|nr:hypothetical protein [Patescibacteria group bacterium]
MKRLFSFLTIISMVVLSSLPAYALPVITEDTKNAIEDASLETRKEVVSTVLQKAEDSIDTLEQQLTSAEYVSEETQNDGQALIDDAQTELDSLQSAV